MSPDKMPTSRSVHLTHPGTMNNYEEIRISGCSFEEVEAFISEGYWGIPVTIRMTRRSERGSGLLSISSPRGDILTMRIEQETGLFLNFIVVRPKGLSPWPSFSPKHVIKGVPIHVDRPEMGAASGKDLNGKISTSSEKIVVWWGPLDDVFAIDTDGILFLLKGAVLMGISFDITDKQKTWIREYISSIPATPKSVKNSNQTTKPNQNKDHQPQSTSNL